MNNRGTQCALLLAKGIILRWDGGVLLSCKEGYLEKVADGEEQHFLLDDKHRMQKRMIIGKLHNSGKMRKKKLRKTMQKTRENLKNCTKTAQNCATPFPPLGYSRPRHLKNQTRSFLNSHSTRGFLFPSGLMLGWTNAGSKVERQKSIWAGFLKGKSMKKGIKKEEGADISPADNFPNDFFAFRHKERGGTSTFPWFLHS